MYTNLVNKKFIDTQIQLRGREKAEEWIKNIPKLVKKYENEWEIEIDKEFPDLSYNFVASAKTGSGQNVVLKIGFLGDKQFLTEAATLKIYDGKGAIRLLKENLEDYVLLLEKCNPGDPLYSLNNEDKETLIFTEVCKKIWKSSVIDHDFPNVADDLKDFNWYFENYERYKDLIDKELVEKAQEKFEYLSETQTDPVLLHSDLHHDNILSSGRGWLAIDCKGVIGEREYEPTAFIRNPIKKAEKNLITREIIKNRISIIVNELELNRERVIDWTFAQTVLSVIWSLQGTGTRAKYWLEIAEEIERIND